MSWRFAACECPGAFSVAVCELRWVACKSTGFSCAVLPVHLPGPPGPSPIPQVLPLVSNGLLAGPGRRALNALLEHSLAHATTQFHCPAPWPRPRRPVAAAAAPTALLKWLEHLQVVLPPLQYRFLGLHAGVRAWGCSAVHIDGVTSAHRMTSDDGLSLTLVGAGLQCDGEYEYSIAHLVPQVCRCGTGAWDPALSFQTDVFFLRC